MKNKLLGMCAALSFIGMTSCDEHRDFPDTGIKVGQVLCTDGKVLSYDEYEESDKEAIAIVFHMNSNSEEDGEGYAVYLHDMPAAAFADTIGVNQGTSADVTAYDGNTNTFAIYSNSDAAAPMAEQVFDMWKYGQSAYVPSVAEMRLLFAAKNDVNPLIEKCGGEPLPDAANDCWYWTSTEVSGQQTAKAWLYSIGSGTMQETPKLQAHKVRPIVTLNK